MRLKYLNNMNELRQPSLIRKPMMAWTAVVGEFLWIGGGALLLLLFFGIGQVLDTAVWLNLVRFPLGLLYVLYFPGYCLTGVLFPYQNDLDNIERAGLSLGLSIAWVSVLALILNWLPSGLTYWPIVAAELGSMSLFAAAAIIRRAHLPAKDLYRPSSIIPRQYWQGRGAPEGQLLIGALLALVFIGSAFGWAVYQVNATGDVTAFYMLGMTDQANHFPRTAVVGEPVTLTVGIKNESAASHVYRIEIWLDNIWSDEVMQLQQENDITLSADETWQKSLEWSMPQPGRDQQIVIYLFSEAPETVEPLRELRLWLDVEGK